MSIQKQFEKFYENIKLTAPQRKDAKDKYSGVCKTLHNYYYPDIDYVGNTKFLIGSYGKHTNIRPPRDVDVLFIMPPDKYKQYSDNGSNGASQLLQDIRGILKKTYTTTEEIHGWGKVVLIKFSDGTHNVELLPAWENDDGTFIIPNSEKGGGWELWDPKSEIEKIDTSNQQTGKTKILIRMVKKWTDNCSVSLKSFEIESAVLDFFSINSAADEYSALVKNFFEFFLDITTDEEVKSHLTTAKNRSAKALEFERDGDFKDAIAEWRKVFGNDFPNYKKSAFVEDFESKLRQLQKDYPSQKEQFLQSDYGISVKIDRRYNLKIDAEVTQNGFRPDWLTNLILNNFPLRKRKNLLFKITENTTPLPYSIKWKVRNFGEEARLASGLRGEITDDKGKGEKSEETLYRGEHYVECYVIKNNTCVAFDRIMVPIGANF